MNFAAVMDAQSAAALGADWLREQLQAVTEYGRRAFASMQPFSPGSEAQAHDRAASLVALAGALDVDRFDELRTALRDAPDTAAIVARAALGAVLSDADLLELQRFLDAAARVDALLRDIEFPQRLPVFEERAVGQALEPGRHGKRGFYLADAFDARLHAARAAADRAHMRYDAARSDLRARVSRELSREDIAGTEFIVMRADRSGALPPGLRVIREAPTYFMCELELDQASLDALEERDRADAEVAGAEERVRAALSATVMEHGGALERLMQRFGALDVLIAQARFVRRFECVAPEIVDEPLIAYEGARFLPLALQLASEGQRYEAIGLRLDGAAVLTGPNMGGKTVALRTTGFIALLSAFGLPVPARSARSGLFDDIAWLGTGAEAAGDGLLSSLARDVVRLRELLERPAQRALLLADEFARTTTPREGKALLVALVKTLQHSNRVALIATHLDGVARGSGARHFAVRGLRKAPATRANDLPAALAALAASMAYEIDEVTGDGERDAGALALAQLLGLDPRLIAEARRVLGGES